MNRLEPTNTGSASTCAELTPACANYLSCNNPRALSPCACFCCVYAGVDEPACTQIRNIASEHE